MIIATFLIKAIIILILIAVFTLFLAFLTYSIKLLFKTAKTKK